MQSTTHKAISQLLTAHIHAGDFPSAAYLVAERGEIVFADALGFAVKTDDVKIGATLATIYDLASLTKPLVTALLCARLVEDDRLALDAPVSLVLSEFARTDKTSITIRQLLTHTSGLPAWLPLYLLVRNEPQRALETIAAQELSYATRTRVVYSDLGFIALGRAIEKIVGASLAEVARQNIFAPLGLRRTFFNPPTELRPQIAASESEGNAYERKMCEDLSLDLKDSANVFRSRLIWGEVHDGNAHFLGGAAGHAGLFADVFDTYTLAAQFLPSTSKLLLPETCAMFRENQTQGLNEARSVGWQLAATTLSTAGESLAPDSYGHNGFAGTSVWIEPHRERIYILLTNRTHAHALPFANINSVRRRFHTLAHNVLESTSTWGV